VKRRPAGRPDPGPQISPITATMSLAPAASIQSSKDRDAEKYPSETGDSTPTVAEQVEKKDPHTDEAKPKKRGLFGFGKKKTDDKSTPRSTVESTSPSPPPTQAMSQLSAQRSATGSPVPLDTPHTGPSSPGRGLYSSSPRVASPAGSQIFERNVQESAAIPTSPAIPSHIQTENHIPPVLDASSEAITDGHLSPDTVEIVTHNSHQPASVTVTGGSLYESGSNSWAEDLAAFADKDEAASNYGSLESADVRRLSFISFADVVQSEHGPAGAVAGSRESIHPAGPTSYPSMSVNRSPSPIRSPVSSQGAETSPPPSKSGSIKGLSMSPVRRPLGSPTATEQSLSTTGELNIETMSQALRRTGSTDLSAHRSLPISPIEGPHR
jgi:hypothetical protein